jgi:hypothetical protein
MDTLSREFKQMNPDRRGIPKDHNSSIGGPIKKKNSFSKIVIFSVFFY